MIPSNELRIGNWVKNVYPYHQNPYQIDAYHIHEAECDKIVFNPIPLTPEVLEKCGFDYTESLHRLGELEIGYDNEDFMLMQYSLRYKKAIILKVKYLHQLQNLYFALTGEELTINL